MRLKQLREEKGITQEALGNAIGQTKSNISKYERGTLEPSIDTLKQIAQFFDVSIDFLIEFETNISKVSIHEQQNIYFTEKKICFSKKDLLEEDIILVETLIETLKIKNLKINQK